MSHPKFLERIHAGEILVADGATGTNLLARGLPRGVVAETWLFERPDAILQLHLDFLQAGADILLTNTFGASPLRLEAGEVGRGVVEVNQRAVDVARQAAAALERQVYIGGSLGPCGKLLKPYGALGEDELYASDLAQVEALAAAGVDFLVIETQFDLKEAALALKAVKTAAPGVPVVCSFSYDRGTRTMMGVSPAKMAAQLSELGPDLLGINCGKGLDDNLKALQELRQATTLPIWFKPNAGLPKVDKEGNTYYDLTPPEMGALAPQWVAEGAAVVGGCCGTSPEHLAAIAAAVKKGE